MKTKCTFFVLFLLMTTGISNAREITFPSLLPPLTEQQASINAEYLLEALRPRPDVKKFFSDPDKARQSLFIQLKNLPHANYELPCHLSAKPESILNFSLPQLIRAYLLLDGLKTGGLTEQMGKVVTSYKKGSQYETGGIGLAENGQLVFEQIASDQFVKTADVLSGYKLPKKDSDRPHIFYFHSHPRLEKTALPGPSWDTSFAQGMEASIYYDIGQALSRAQRNGDSHQLLISDMGNKRFNLVYYAAEKVKLPENPDPFLYCYKLKGFHIVNLAIWRY